MDRIEVDSIPVVRGVPESHWDCFFDNFDFEEHEELREITLRFLEGEQGWLYLHGQPGRGKTHYAVALHRALVAQLGFEGAESSIFIEFRRMMEELRASNEDFSVDARLEAYLASETLILDDVTGAMSPYDVKILEEIIKRTHASEGRLVITSNEESSRFLSMFGEHEVSRFQELAYIVSFGGLDHRTS